jgi:hypothetical protein
MTTAPHFNMAAFTKRDKPSSAFVETGIKPLSDDGDDCAAHLQYVAEACT